MCKNFHLAFLVSLLVGFLGSVIGGILITTPAQIASHLSVAFYISGGMAAQTFGTTTKERLVLIFVGAVGGTLGWFIYHVFVLYVASPCIITN